MESLNVAMEEVCVEVSALNPDNKEEEINQRYESHDIHIRLWYTQLIKSRYIRRADVLSKEIHAKHGLTQEVLQAAMMKYQQEPLFLSKMVNLQAQQSDRFVKAAAIFNGEVNMGAPP